ncbi:MAG: sulfotransferase family 2 domain-containing protein [Actinobacteria bacterium]|nr:sulfotransferase family 2 domain-containing protein [Actinomycetota bacterium]
MTSRTGTIIFLHIGKTAGSTLRKVLHRNVPRDQILLVQTPQRRDTYRPRRESTIDAFASMPETTRSRARLVEGHVIFGIHRFVPGPSTYITVLRDPVALAVSQYRYVVRTPGHRLHDIVMSEAMGLEDYVRSGISLEMDNSQTRAISGDVSAPFGGCSQAMLDAATQHIDEHFSVVGLTERFDESLVLMGRTFGWKRLAYLPVKVAPKSREPISEEVRGLLEEQNRFDLALYRYAGRRFEREVQNLPAFEADLRRFRRRNAAYRRAGGLVHAVPQRLGSAIRQRRAVASTWR